MRSCGFLQMRIDLRHTGTVLEAGALMRPIDERHAEASSIDISHHCSRIG